MSGINSHMIVLIGVEKSLRTEYFLKAASDLNVKAEFIEIPSFDSLNKFNFLSLKNAIVKVDPPEDIPAADRLEDWANKYKGFLHSVEQACGGRMLNSGSAITCVLDKLESKRILHFAKISTTPLIDITPKTADELRRELLSRRIYRVFIKPRLGSGAYGVIAYRINPKTGEEIVETSAAALNGKLLNTSVIKKINNSKVISELINSVLSVGGIVEKWIPKASFGDKNYDLRVVYQFGHTEFMVARQSRNPITNLHLNNDALKIGEIGLSNEIKSNIENLCRKAMAQFSGLNSAGIDVLLERNTLKPYIIEINGQGDLIYQDIFNKNIIYKSQIKNMLKY